MICEVPLLDLKAQTESLREDIDDALASVLDATNFVLGTQVAELETQIAAFVQASSAAAVASGTDALLLALKACDIGPGDEVITTPYTFFATAGAIHNVGARPVFVDVDEETFNIRPDQIEVQITARSKALIPVHLFGQCADMKPLIEVAQRHGIHLIEDAAQAIGARQRLAGKDMNIGNFGRCACLSFFPSKNLGGIGDGGMIVSNDEDFIARVKILRVHGGTPKYYHHVVGFNSRLDTVNAAVLLAKLRRLESWSDKRRENAARYRELFRNYGLEETIKLPSEQEGNTHVYNQFVIECSKRDQLQEFLKQRRISTAIYYPVPLHLQKCFEFLGYKEGDFPVSERLAKESLALPIYPELSLQQQDHVVQSIRDFYQDLTPYSVS
ncbi:MAG: DegT/DnrJ/EryC1/StrS family aminotransferase [Acidobacteriota bacterium]